MTDAMLVRTLLRTTWFLLGLMLVGVLVLKNLPPDGVLEERALAGQVSAFVGVLRPEGRVILKNDGGETRYLVTSDPTYFQLGVPRFFNRAVLTIEFRGDVPSLAIGPLASAETWGFALQELDSLARPAKVLSDGWKRASVAFNLDPKTMVNGEVQTAFSSPSLLKQPGILEIRSITARYERAPLTLTTIVEALKKHLAL